jgi:FtsZ-binding cell division protein ZapB
MTSTDRKQRDSLERVHTSSPKHRIPLTKTVETYSIHCQTDKEFEKPSVKNTDYQQLIERFKEDNDDLRKRVKELDKDNTDLRLQVNELSTEKMAWTRVEQGLKERIHKLQ